MKPSGIILLILLFAFLGFSYYGIPWFYMKYLRVRLGKLARKDRVLALTFDDGPSTVLTPIILDTLSSFHVSASFFLLGCKIAGREDVVRRIIADGHEICCHGYFHLHAWRSWPWRYISNVLRGFEAIDKALGKSGGTYPFRPPYGKLDLITLLYLAWHGIPIVLWTSDSCDTHSSRSLRQRPYIRDATEGGVILLHDFDRSLEHNRAYVTRVARDILESSKDACIRLVTISTLIGPGNHVG